MVIKASINGPNRRSNRVGDTTKASNFDKKETTTTALAGRTQSSSHDKIYFKVKSLEKYLEQLQEGKETEDCSDGSILHTSSTIGDSCIFMVGPDENDSGRLLLEKHFGMVSSGSTDCSSSSSINNIDPLLIHFHDLPIFILRAIPLTIKEKSNKHDCEGEQLNLIYLSQAHCHNHKICEDTVYGVTCCSRPLPPPNVSSTSEDDEPRQKYDYDIVSAVGVEVFLRYSNDRRITFRASDVAKMIMNQTLFSVLSVNECMIINVSGCVEMDEDMGKEFKGAINSPGRETNVQLVCRVSRVCVVRNQDDVILGNTSEEVSSAEACLDEPYRGRVNINTEFYVTASNPDSIQLEGERMLPEGTLPEDVIHVTTNDGEWFPVRRILLAPCIHLTKYVQAGRGKFRDVASLNLAEEERSPDAPADGIHCKVDTDCCTFDRVLLFIMSQLYPKEYKFALELSETNALSQAADVLGLQPLSDLCQSQISSFASRVRSDKFIRFSEVKKRNEQNELLIIVDGMVLDITRWIEEHPGGPSIIPTQGLNIDCTCFFEMYHVSKQSFLYLKSFYIGELNPADLSQLCGNEIRASEGFLQSLRSYTDQWRVEVEEHMGDKIHKSL